MYEVQSLFEPDRPAKDRPERFTFVGAFGRTASLMLIAVAAVALACGGQSRGGGSGDEAAGAAAATGDARVRIELTADRSGAVWASAADDLFVAGALGVHHFDGEDWELQLAPVQSSFSDLFGSASDDVYGLMGRSVFRFDGESWEPIYEAGEVLLDLWLSARDDIHVVGRNGLALHFDGTDWETIPTGVTANLTEVEGTSAAFVYATSSSPASTPGQILRFAGTRWEPQSITSAQIVRTIAPLPSGRIFLSDSRGGLFIGQAGGNFSDIDVLPFFPLRMTASGPLEVIGPAPDNQVFRWNNRNLELTRFDAQTLEVFASDFGLTYAVGRQGQIAFHDGTDWQILRPARNAVDLLTTFGAPDGTLFALGSESYAYLEEEWVLRNVPAGLAIHGGSAISRDFAIAVGDGGAIDHWDGTRWERAARIGTGRLNDVWAHSETVAFAVGATGDVLGFDGRTWTVTENLQAELVAVHGTAPNDVFAVSAGGDVFHFDGVDWSPMVTPPVGGLTSVFAVSASNVFAVGGAGTAIRFDGDRWERVESSDPGRLLQVWARDRRAVFALSSTGSIVRFDGESFVPFARVSNGGGNSLSGDGESLAVVGASSTIYRVDL